jgi:3-methylcrotonyl-CoA carboxylase alpha subunit
LLEKDAMKRVLIANRGEIACRIAATCAQMGIEVVSIYAANERTAPHAFVGDMAVQLEGDTLAETYLNIEQLIDVATRTGADAVHPGYGFLSENAAFPEALKKHGITFIGPTGPMIRQMGDKAASRQLCHTIGVPVVPGYDGEETDPQLLANEAQNIGYPVMVKAAAGGGGKGMRIVDAPDGFVAALETARSEAQHAFGDARILLEKYVANPRHIEVQVFSDSHGNHLHVFERECSIQRRHQKIIEESPSPNLTEERRAEMTEAALKITRHIGYVGAGTVEFIVDGNTGDFYFLEMNTRLQVEHPVTEMITGLDLVRWQIIAARGEALPLKQEEITCTGHAIEVRLYAEDPEKDFMPSPGTLHEFSLPHAPYLRCESGVAKGSDVTAHYDPMLAKLVTWGNCRGGAMVRMQHALANTRIAGVANNRDYLQRIFAHPAFRNGDISTHFIAQHKEELAPTIVSNDQLAMFAAAALMVPAGVALSGGDRADMQEHSAWSDAALVGWR